MEEDNMNLIMNHFYANMDNWLQGQLLVNLQDYLRTKQAKILKVNIEAKTLDVRLAGSLEDGSEDIYGIPVRNPEDFDEGAYVLCGYLQNNISTLFVLGEGGTSLPVQGDKNYIHVQAQPSDTWIVNHQMRKYPNINVVDLNGKSIVGVVQYIDPLQVQIKFNYPLTGKVYCN